MTMAEWTLHHCVGLHHSWALSGTQVAESKAGRCFYVANAYLISGKQLEAHALFGRAAQHAKQAVKQHKVGLLSLCCTHIWAVWLVCRIMRLYYQHLQTWTLCKSARMQHA